MINSRQLLAAAALAGGLHIGLAASAAARTLPQPDEHTSIDRHPIRRQTRSV